MCRAHSSCYLIIILLCNYALIISVAPSVYEWHFTLTVCLVHLPVLLFCKGK